MYDEYDFTDPMQVFHDADELLKALPYVKLLMRGYMAIENEEGQQAALEAMDAALQVRSFLLGLSAENLGRAHIIDDLTNDCR